MINNIEKAKLAFLYAHFKLGGTNMRESNATPRGVKIANVLCAIFGAVLVVILLYQDLSREFRPTVDDAPGNFVVLEENPVPLAAPPNLSQGFALSQLQQDDLLTTFQIDHTYDSRAVVGNTIWDNTNVDFQNGIMELNLERSDDPTRDIWHGTQVRALSETGYGLYEVEMKPYVSTPGVVTAFFLYNFSSLDEIDIEFNSQHPNRVELNYFAKGLDLGTVQGQPVIIDLEYDAFADFHTYGFYYGSDIIIWYIDGEEVYRTDCSQTPEDVDSQFYAMVSLWAGGDEYVDWLGQTTEPRDGSGISAYVRAVRYDPSPLS